MLFGLTKKLCPLMSLAALALGCGKKINDPETTSGDGTRYEEQRPSSVLVLEIKTNESSKLSYTVPFNGYFFFPSKLTMKAGSGLGKTVRFIYDIDKNGEYDYLCYYKSTVEPTELRFDKCLNADGADLEVNPDDFDSLPWLQRKGNRVEMELVSGFATNLRINAVFSVDWK